jgi:hypothetical protein
MSASQPNLGEASDPSDTDWLDLVRRASANGAHYFTENQLYCQYARGRVRVTRYISGRGKLGLAMVVVGLGIWIYGLKVDWGLSLVLGIGITLGGVAYVGTGVVTRRDPAAREPVTRWLDRWLSGEPQPKLLREPALGHAGLELSPARVECLLIVERDILVDLLVNNAAPKQLSALIIAESGYPESLLPEARRLLDERSDLKVIALHDATARGVELRSRLQAGTVLPLGDRPIIDAGLFAADVGQLQELATAFPASHFRHVPVDALSYATLLAGLVGVARGELSLSAGMHGEIPPRNGDAERAA